MRSVVAGMCESWSHWYRSLISKDFAGVKPQLSCSLQFTELWHFPSTAEIWQTYHPLPLSRIYLRADVITVSQHRRLLPLIQNVNQTSVFGKFLGP
jgi:hypothetical protein